MALVRACRSSCASPTQWMSSASSGASSDEESTGFVDATAGAGAGLREPAEVRWESGSLHVGAKLGVPSTGEHEGEAASAPPSASRMGRSAEC